MGWGLEPGPEPAGSRALTEAGLKRLLRVGLGRIGPGQLDRVPHVQPAAAAEAAAEAGGGGRGETVAGLQGGGGRAGDGGLRWRWLQ